MNKIKFIGAPIGLMFLLIPVFANSASNFSITNSGGFFLSAEEDLVDALTNGESVEYEGGFVAPAFVTGSFVYDASNNVASGSDNFGAIYSGAVTDLVLKIADAEDVEEQEFILNAALSVGGAIVGDQKLNAQDLLSLGGNQAASTNWNGFTACWPINSATCYTLTSISVNYIGDDFVCGSQMLPRGLPPVGYAETTNKKLALSLTFEDANNVEHTVGTVVTVNCESVDGCPQLPSDPTSDPALTDTDGDGCMDSVDFFLSDATECKDTDLDGMGNNADLDDDGDGLSDVNEVARGANPLKADSDSDGLVDGQDGFPTLDAVSSISTSGAIAERLVIKGCISTARSVPAKLNFSGALFTAEVGDQWLTGLSAAAGKKIGISINGDGQAQMLKSLRALAPSCTINSITGQKVSLALNKAKTQAKLDAKITLSATVLVKGKVKTVKGTYTMKSVLPWTPNN